MLSQRFIPLLVHVLLSSKATASIITARQQNTAIVPTSEGQIGVNPVTNFGPASQYIGEVGPHSKVVFLQNGNTVWRGSSSDRLTEVPITRTIGGEVETEIAPVQMSATKATASADGLKPGDVSVVIVPALKEALKDFAETTIEICSLELSELLLTETASSTAMEQCFTREAVKASQRGGTLNRVFETIDLEAGKTSAELPEVAGANIDVVASALQIAKDQLRRKGAWLLITVLSTYSTTKEIYNVYKLPKEPTKIHSVETPSATPSCKSGAPTGINAPVCRDDDCQGLPVEKKCQSGEWKHCDCLGTILINNPPTLVDVGWIDAQQKLMQEVESTP